MLVDVGIRPDNPIYRGCQIETTRVNKRDIHHLRSEMNNETGLLIQANFIEHFRALPKDAEPVRLSGSAPNWVYTIIQTVIWREIPGAQIQLKKGKHTLTLPLKKEQTEKGTHDS